MAELVYQRWVEVDAPEGCAGVQPMASWVVPLADGGALVTLLYRPLVAPGADKVGPKTVLVKMTAEGQSEAWGPGANYPAAVMVCANEAGEMYGFDLTMPGKVYVCDVAGTHIGTLEMDLRMASILMPQLLREVEGRVVWVNRKGRGMCGKMVDGGLVDVQEMTDEQAKACTPCGEVHLGHTHLCCDGCLYVLDHEPMTRVSKYRLVGGS